MILRFLVISQANSLQYVMRLLLKNKVKKVLELGCGQGRDSLFFASKGLDVHGIDSSKIAIETLIAKTKELKVDINVKY